MADRDGAPVIAANNVYRIARYKWHSLHDVTLPLSVPPASQLPLFRPATTSPPLLLCSHDTRQIGGKCSSNRIPLSTRVYPRYSLFFFFFFPPPHRNLFFTEFLEQFVTIPPVLSPVCNIDIFPTWSGIFNVFQKGKRAVRRFVIYLFTGGGFNYREYNNNCDFSRSPSSLFLLFTLYDLLPKLIDIRYFFFFGLSCSPRKTPPYIPCVRFMTLLFFTSIGPITTKKPVLSNDWTSIFTKKCRKGNTDRRSLSLFLLPI